MIKTMHKISSSNNLSMFDTQMNTLLIFKLCYAGSVDLITRQDQGLPQLAIVALLFVS
jgi:hypothetical protein